MFCNAAKTLLDKFGIGQDERNNIVGTGPVYALNKHWVTKFDVLNFIKVKQQPILFTDIRQNNGVRHSVWCFENDPIYRSESKAYSLCNSYNLRDYQEKAVESCFKERGMQSAIIDMCCAAGKTYVGSAIMMRMQVPTIIITTHCVSVQQWRLHLINMGITPGNIAVLNEYSVNALQLPPIIITTYTMYAMSCANENSSNHNICSLTQVYDALLILDEVHSASACTYQQVFSQRSKCRIGLTATLCREDDGIEMLFKFIGPVSYIVRADVLVKKGYISASNHFKITIPLSPYAKTCYENTENANIRQQISILNPNKIGVLLGLIRRHLTKHILVFCDIIDCINEVYNIVCQDGIRAIGPVTGATTFEERIQYFEHFEKATTACLFLSKVGDNALSLNSANIIIKISTVSRSRTQEEQRNGRGARKSKSDTILYTLLTKATQEEVFFDHRDKHLSARGCDVECVDLEKHADSLDWQREDLGLMQRIKKEVVTKVPKKRGRPQKA